MIKRLLVVVAIATITVIVAACSGGTGNAGDPCCAATGATEAPPAPFTASAASAYRAEAIVLDSSACIDATADAGILVGSHRIVGGPVDVDASGRYTLDIDKDAVGEQVLVRVFPSAADAVTLGIGALPASMASNGDATLYNVAPINFTAGAANLVGESTVELVAYCQLKAIGGLQNMTLADVRAAVSRDLAAGINLDDGTTSARAGIAITRYRHGINGVVGAVASAQRQSFADLREYAQRVVDACRDGRKIETAARIPCDGDSPGAEFYRAWVIARRAEQSLFPSRSREHLIGWAFDVEKALVPDLADPFANIELRQAWMLRFEATDHALTSAADTLPIVEPVAVQILTSNLEAMRAMIIDPATTTFTLANEWERVGDYLIPILKGASPQVGDTCDFDAFKTTGDQQGRGVFMDFAGLDPTHTELVDRIFLSTTSLAASQRNLLQASCVTLDQPAEQAQLEAWTDIFTYLTLNVSPVNN